jgi:hypothetical protein
MSVMVEMIDEATIELSMTLHLAVKGCHAHVLYHSERQRLLAFGLDRLPCRLL